MPVENTFALLNGRLTLTGPTAPEDALWLAASIPTLPAGTPVLDAGCGTGTAALALLTRQPHLNVTGVEINPELLPHAKANATRNHLNFTPHLANILTFTSATKFPLILSNPPYHASARGHSTPNAHKSLAHSMPENLLTAWLSALTSLLAPQGTLHLILHTACEAELLTFARNTSSSTTLTPLQTSPKNPPKRLLATLQPHTTYTLTTNPTLTTHNPEFREKILRQAQPLPSLSSL